MSNRAPKYDIDPNRLRVDGPETYEAVAIAMEIDRDGVRIDARTGTVSSQNIELSYGEIEAVETVEELAYALVVDTEGTQYTVTNVTASERKIDEITAYVRDQIRRFQRNGTQPGADTGPTTNGATANGANADKDDGSAEISAAEELQKWVELNEQGVISDEELEEKKRKLL